MRGLNAGWYRLWAVAACVFIVAAVVVALNSNDASPEWARCVPGTTESHYDDAMMSLPTRSEISAERASLLSNPDFADLPPAELGEVAVRFAEARIQRAARYEECVSVGRLLENLWWAFLAVSGLIASSLTARWIGQGFWMKEK